MTRVALAVLIVVAGSSASAGETYTCAVKEALWLDKESGLIRPHLFYTEQNHSRRITIDKATGQVSNSAAMFVDVTNWKRVHPASDDDTFNTRGYASNSNPTWDIYIVDLSVLGPNYSTEPKTFVAIEHPEQHFYSGVCQ
jgi:hypothetical protein